MPLSVHTRSVRCARARAHVARLARSGALCRPSPSACSSVSASGCVLALWLAKKVITKVILVVLLVGTGFVVYNQREELGDLREHL